MASLGGELSLDAVPGWSTHIFVELPLTAQEPPSVDALRGLNPRELQVLGRGAVLKASTLPASPS